MPKYSWVFKNLSNENVEIKLQENKNDSENKQQLIDDQILAPNKENEILNY